MYEQVNIFEVTKPKYKITKPIRLIEMFAGIGSQAKALKNLNIPFEHYFICEIDKYAVSSYNAIHNTNFNTTDIKYISSNNLNILDTNKYEYILTYSFPCTDLSLAGKREGMKKGSNTRSGLLWEVERLLDELCGFKEHIVSPKNTKIHSLSNWVDDFNYDIDKTKLPQILLMENVPQVISKENFPDFREWQIKLESLGYSNYFELLNAKDYGIPQNRNRCFMISILGNYYYEFPKEIPLKLRLKDMLEEEVEEKYYLSEKTLAYVLDMDNIAKKSGRDINDRIVNPTIAKTISCRGAESQRADVTNFVIDNVIKEIKVKDLKDTICLNSKVNGKQPSLQDRIYDTNVISTAITTCYMPSIAIPEDTKLYQLPRGKNKGGIKENCTTISSNSWQENNFIYNNLRIRKLTPRECFRLMGFSDEDFYKASKVNSNAQLYKQAGNSIVVNVLMAIFKELF